MDIDLWARSLAGQIQAHIEDDGTVLPQYLDLAELAGDERIRYLMHLVLDDAVRHQRILQEMVNWLRAESESRPVAGPRVPDHSGNATSARTRGQAIALAGEVLAAERSHERELRTLRQQVETVEDTAWWAVLLATMETDTRKHIALLEYIRRTLAR